MKRILVLLLLLSASLQAQTYINSNGTLQKNWRVGRDGFRLQYMPNYLPAGNADRFMVQLRDPAGISFRNFIARELYVNHGDTNKVFPVVPLKNTIVARSGDVPYYDSTSRSWDLLPARMNKGGYIRFDESGTKILSDSIYIDGAKITLTQLGGLFDQHSAAIALNSENITLEVQNRQGAVSGLQDQVNFMQSSIDVMADSISQKVSRYTLEGTLVYYKGKIDTVWDTLAVYSSRISQNADQLDLRVLKSDYTGANLVSMINLTPQAITLSASKINFSGFTTFMRASEYMSPGKTTIDGSKITTGTLTADAIYSGRITGNAGYIDLDEAEGGNNIFISSEGLTLRKSGTVHLGGTTKYIEWDKTTDVLTLTGEITSTGKFETKNGSLVSSLSAGTLNLGYDYSVISLRAKDTHTMEVDGDISVVGGIITENEITSSRWVNAAQGYKVNGTNLGISHISGLATALNGKANSFTGYTGTVDTGGPVLTIVNGIITGVAP
ncbi:MAG: hypothetical protein ACM3SM_00405 [Bacteroidota bacterium]